MTEFSWSSLRVGSLLLYSFAPPTKKCLRLFLGLNENKRPYALDAWGKTMVLASNEESYSLLREGLE